MTQTNYLHAHPATAKLIADGVVAAYVHDLSRRHPRDGAAGRQSASRGSIGPEPTGRVDPLTS